MSKIIIFPCRHRERTGSGGDLADPRHNDHKKPHVHTYLKRFGARKAEANALVVRPRQGRQLCREAIFNYVDEPGSEAYDLDEARKKARRAIAARRAP